jgi:hypothetical protein
MRSLLIVPPVLAAAVAAAGCFDTPAALTQLMDARRLAAEIHVAFTRSTEAANRAVMSDDDTASAAAVEEARASRKAIDAGLETLRGLLDSLGYAGDRQHLDAFAARYDEYRKLDDEILAMAAENTNVKAQRLSFGPVREASGQFRSALEAVARAAPEPGRWRAEALAAKARGALLDVQVLHAPHIAEGDLGAMDRMEAEMSARLGEARAAVDGLERLVPPERGPLAEARAALDRFQAVHAELIMLSRRNSDVRSLALSLGRKRTVAAECEAHLQALEQALGRHSFTGTR